MEEEEEDKGSMESTQTVSKEKMTRTRSESLDRDQRKKHNTSASSQDQQFLKILKKNRTVLVDNADFRHFRDDLRQEDLLTCREIQDIEAERTPYKQMGRFLDIMERKTDSSVEKLLNIWKEKDPILYEQLNLSVPQADVVPAGHEHESIDTIKRELQDWYINTTSRLRPIPWVEWLEINLPHVFTNLEMVPGRKNEICPRFKSEDDDKNKLNNLFNKGPDQRSVCFVEGPAGIGKSTLCKHLVYKWSKDNFTIVDHSFDFALLLEARILTEDLKKCINQQLFPEDFEFSEDCIYECLQKHQKTCLIIIDGVDELTPGGKTTVMKLLKGERLRHVNLVLTGRPEASRGFIKHSNSHFKITGFTDKNVEAYICKYFGSEENSLKDSLISRVEKDKELSEIMRNPFTTLLVCLLFKDKNGILPLDLTEIQWEVLEICCRKYITKIKNSYTADMTQETLLSAAAHLAYEGYRRNCTVYPEESLASFCPNDSSEHLLKSGILCKDFTVSRLNAKGFCFFPHKTFQELLCAKYLSELDNEKLGEKLKRIFQLDYIALNLFQNLLDMLQSKRKSEVVLESLCQQVELGRLFFVDISELVSAHGSALIDFLSWKLDTSHRLLCNTCFEYSVNAGFETECKHFVKKMRLPPVAYFMCDSYRSLEGRPSFVEIPTERHVCNLLLDDPLSLLDTYWPFVNCYSLDAAVDLLKRDVKVNVLTILLQASDCHLLLVAKRLLQSSRPTAQVKHVVFLYLEYAHQDENVLTLLSRISNLQNVVFLKIKHSPVISSEQNNMHVFTNLEMAPAKKYPNIIIRREIDISSPGYEHLNAYTVQYYLHSSINQLYYNKFSPY